MAQSEGKGFTEVLVSPWVLLPLTGALSLVIIAWVLPRGKEYAYLGSLGFLVIGIGALMTLVILNWGSGEDPQRAKVRFELLNGMDSVCQLDQRVFSREAERGATPAQMEKT